MPIPMAEADGMEDVIRALSDQSATLRGLVQMQADLKSLVETQHQKLETVLRTMRSPAGDVGLPPAPEVESQGLEETKQEAVEAAFTDKITPMTAVYKYGKKSKDSNNCDPLTESSTRTMSMMVAQEKSKNEFFRKKWRKILAHPYWDALSGFVILLNFLALYIELEWRSKHLAFMINLEDADIMDWADAKQVFIFLEQLFNGAFVVELLLDLWAFGLRGRLHQHQFLMWVDRLAITLSALEVFVIDPLLESEGTKAISLLRMVRVAKAIRLLRFLRVLRFMGMFSALRVLVQTLQKSVGSLFWSMAVVGFIVLSCALFVCTLTQDIIANEGLEEDTREWVFLYFGGASRASYTLFEAAFSGIWASRLSRTLIEKVSPWWSVWWILYGVIVNFAVVRIISALFLKQTLDVAAIDAERQALMKRKEHDQVVMTLSDIFRMGDQLGDGLLHKWEFEEMMEKDEVLEKFEALELETPELFMLFDILSEEDGKADFEEFLNGALKLKSSVRTMDIVNILHEQLVIKRYLGVVADGIQHIDKALHPHSPWKPGFGLNRRVHTELAQAAIGAGSATKTKLVEQEAGSAFAEQTTGNGHAEEEAAKH